MNLNYRIVECCPVCGSIHGAPFVTRADGIFLRRCQVCTTLYLECVPIDIAALYADNYFALVNTDVRDNAESRVGCETSYESAHLNAEFYWAYRLADQIASWFQGPADTGRCCLDVGAATGCLLNVFAAAGYETYGIEFSAHACDIAASRGHKMSQLSPGTVLEHAARFEVVTALEVIEHVEDLPGFFTGIHTVMADKGVFVGYFPSSDDVAFFRGTDYHWLHKSFEHLVYPSEAGIRMLLKPFFGTNVFFATFFTRQGADLIPNSVVVAFKGEVPLSTQTVIAELFRQLAYLNDRTCFDMDASRGAGALAPTWGGAGDVVGPEGDVPYVAGVLSAKFGNLEAARLFLCEGDYLEKLDSRRLTDLLVIALHGGSIDWLRTNLPVILPRITMALIASDCSMVVERYDAQHPKTEVASSERLMNEGHGK
jgi:SAM-dependent methyltransferase